MNDRHPHYDVIVAWAEGKTIQAWNAGLRVWYDWTIDHVAPAFTRDGKYRVKPEVSKYRVAMLKDDRGVYFTTAWKQEDEEFVEQLWGFIRWVSDWVEVEI